MPRTTDPGTNTGRKDAKNRTIYQRASGTLFVQTRDGSGKMKRIAPAMGRGVAHGPSQSRNTGRQNARGNPIWITATGKERSRRTSKSGAVYFTQPHTSAASTPVYRPKFGPSRVHQTDRFNYRGNPIWMTAHGGNAIRRTSAKTGKVYFAKPYSQGARTAKPRPTYTSTGFTNTLGRQVMMSPAGHYYAIHDGKQTRIGKDKIRGHFLNM
jgi:hypothetical protein